MKFYCPFCGSEEFYVRFDEGFDWDSDNNMTLVPADCEQCGERFGVWIGIQQVFKFDKD